MPSQATHNSKTGRAIKPKSSMGKSNRCELFEVLNGRGGAWGLGGPWQRPTATRQTEEDPSATRYQESLSLTIATPSAPPMTLHCAPLRLDSESPFFSLPSPFMDTRMVPDLVSPSPWNSILPVLSNGRHLPNRTTSFQACVMHGRLEVLRSHLQKVTKS